MRTARINGSVKAYGLKKNLQTAFETSFERLKQLDPVEMSDRAGATLLNTDDGNHIIVVNYFDRPVTVDMFFGAMESDPAQWEEFGGIPKPSENLFIVHYLENATGKKPTSSLVPFRNMDGGSTYNSVFQGRAVNRLVRAFRTKEALLLDVSAGLGGISAGIGDVSVRFRVLPNIDIILVLWRGDEEMLSSGNILFDSAITDYLPSEDCVVMAEYIVSRIIEIYKSLPKNNDNPTDNLRVNPNHSDQSEITR